jgi:hypothetical protein
VDVGNDQGSHMLNVSIKKGFEKEVGGGKPF